MSARNYKLVIIQLSDTFLLISTTQSHGLKVVRHKLKEFCNTNRMFQTKFVETFTTCIRINSRGEWDTHTNIKIHTHGYDYTIYLQHSIICYPVFPFCFRQP